VGSECALWVESSHRLRAAQGWLRHENGGSMAAVVMLYESAFR
jgi:hypothetical protein